MKKHPDSQPRCAVAVNGGDDNDGDANKQFEGEWIDRLSSSMQESDRQYERAHSATGSCPLLRAIEA
jgi:hypothetical protein